MAEATMVFAKTAKGSAEIAQRSNAISAIARRVLIMVDGKRSVRELAPLVPPGQIDAVLAELQALGFIEAVAAVGAVAAPPASASAPAREGGSERLLLSLEEAKRRAARGLIERLGPEADGMAARIEACRNAEELAEALRRAERLLAGAIGAAAAESYLRELRGR